MKVALAFEIYTDYKDIKQAFNYFFLKSWCDQITGSKIHSSNSLKSLKTDFSLFSALQGEEQGGENLVQWMFESSPR